MDKKGLTLVELLIVIGIIAVLAIISIPIFSKVMKKANKAAIWLDYNIILDGIKGEGDFDQGVEDIFIYFTEIKQPQIVALEGRIDLTREQFISYLKTKAINHDTASIDSIKIIDTKGSPIRIYYSANEGQTTLAKIVFKSIKGFMRVEITSDGLFIDGRLHTGVE